MPSPILRFAATGLLACCAGVAFAQSVVTPPPLPPGSTRVRPDAGLQEPERKRYVRAHHHKFQHKRDYTHDDSLDPPTAQGKGNGNANGKGAK